MSNGNALVGTSARVVVYCGHRVWSRYQNTAGKWVEPGGVVTVREEWTGKEGDPQHAIREYRVDPEADVQQLGKTLHELACGAAVEMTLNSYESARGTQWRNVIDISET